LTGTLFPPQASTFEKGHGRIESRRIWLSDILRGYVNFPHVEVVFRLERRVSKLEGSCERSEVVYGVTSLGGTGREAAERLLRLVRGHWVNRKPAALGARCDLRRGS
jgi:hypothetical protein